MDDSTRKICRLCQKVGNDYFTTGDITKQMLDVLLNLNLVIAEDSMICIECRTKLQNFVDFISSCNTESRISAVNPENDKLISKENIYEDHKLIFNNSEEPMLCRFCKKLIGNECVTYLHETKDNIFMVDMIQRYVPELHLNNIEKLVTCETCLSTLRNILKFIMDCFDVEEKNKRNIDETDDQTQLQLKDANDSKTWYEDSCNNMNVDVRSAGISAICGEIGENVNVKCEVKDDDPELDDQLYIKNEVMEIKFEPNYCESFESPTPQLTLECMKVQKSPSEIKRYKCKMCPYQAKYKSTLKNHTKTHQKNPSEIKRYKCEKCPYQANYKSTLKKHTKTHQNTPKTKKSVNSEIKIHKCEICPFETKYKGNLTQHTWTHQSTSDLTMYHCESCPYKTKYLKGLKSHTLYRHNPSGHNPSALQDLRIYKCDVCPFETKYKYGLDMHTRIHQGSYYLKMYKCDSCPFQTKHRVSLRKHLVIHQNLSQLKMYTCDRCAFKSKHKTSLNMHMLVHRKPEEIKMYKCDKCSYEMKYKASLARHIMLMHQNPSQVIMYKCDICTFETKHKNGLNLHKLTHMSPSEIKMYGCEKCSYKTRQKSCVKRHMTTHLKKLHRDDVK